MGLEGKLEAEVEMKSSADTVFKMLSEEVHNISDASSNNVRSVEVHEGEQAQSSSGLIPSEFLKEKIVVDKESRTVTMLAVSGHVLDKYKAYKVACQVLPDGCSAKVKVVIVYEKLDENHADPDNYLRFIVNFIKDTDAHLVGMQR